MGQHLALCRRRRTPEIEGEADWIIIHPVHVVAFVPRVHWLFAVKKITQILHLRMVCVKLGRYLQTHKTRTYHRALIASSWSCVGRYLQRQRSRALTLHLSHGTQAARERRRQEAARQEGWQAHPARHRRG